MPSSSQRSWVTQRLLLLRQPKGWPGVQRVAHDLWEELGNQIYLYLNSVTVADVVNRRILGTSGLFPGGGRGPRVAAE